ncbi:hypothetical protein F2Q70_00002607 [Brassica cretica]|uniref:Uncharacterized protein n=2 Tax=Brassica cretica TaxID=69181 RepID=A0A8S9J3E7_BRACR|nr:hypothetical protein F2Q70_00002607 [Brassica cretica]
MVKPVSESTYQISHRLCPCGRVGQAKRCSNCQSNMKSVVFTTPKISVYVSPPFTPPRSIPSFNPIFMREPISSFHLPLFLLLYKPPPPRISLRSTFYDLIHLMVLHDMSLNSNQVVVGKLSENGETSFRVHISDFS